MNRRQLEGKISGRIRYESFLPGPAIPWGPLAQMATQEGWGDGFAILLAAS